jgi:hypothetical protein
MTDNTNLTYYDLTEINRAKMIQNNGIQFYIDKTPIATINMTKPIQGMGRCSEGWYYLSDAQIYLLRTIYKSLHNTNKIEALDNE